MNEHDGWSPELGVVRIATPCRASWERMAGDERVRFCKLCQLNVYDLSAMSADEARLLLLEREGRLCVRFARRADGRLLTRDCPVGLRAKWRLRAAAAISAALALVSWVLFWRQNPVRPLSPMIPIAHAPRPAPAPKPAQSPPDEKWISDRRAQLHGGYTYSMGIPHRTIQIIRAKP